MVEGGERRMMDILIALTDFVSCGKICFVGTVRGGDDSCSFVFATVARLVTSRVGVWVCGVAFIGSAVDNFTVYQRGVQVGVIATSGSAVGRVKRIQEIVE